LSGPSPRPGYIAKSSPPRFPAAARFTAAPRQSVCGHFHPALDLVGPFFIWRGAPSGGRWLSRPRGAGPTSTRWIPALGYFRADFHHSGSPPLHLFARPPNFRQARPKCFPRLLVTAKSPTTISRTRTPWEHETTTRPWRQTANKPNGRSVQHRLVGPGLTVLSAVRWYHVDLEPTSDVPLLGGRGFARASSTIASWWTTGAHVVDHAGGDRR